MRVLQLQTDLGFTGGIAGYISSLTCSKSMDGIAFVVVVPGLREGREAAASLYGNAELAVMPKTYGLKNFISYSRSLYSLIKSGDFDVIHAHAIRSAFAAAVVGLFTGVPLVYTNHGLRYTQKKNPFERAAFFVMEVLVCRIAGAVVAIRRFDSYRLRRSRLVTSPKLYTVCSRVHAIKGDTPKRARTRSLQVLGVGSLIEVKRVDRFINWVKGLQERNVQVEACWVGDGPLKAILQHQALELGLSIEWCGQLSKVEVLKRLQGADLFFLTSDFEVFPLAVLEAYSFGVPVISGRFDGVEDFIESDVTGVLVDADDTESVALQVISLLNNPEMFKSMSDAAKTRFDKNYSNPELMALEYLSIYDKVVRGE